MQKNICKWLPYFFSRINLIWTLHFPQSYVNDVKIYIAYLQKYENLALHTFIYIVFCFYQEYLLTSEIFSVCFLMVFFYTESKSGVKVSKNQDAGSILSFLINPTIANLENYKSCTLDLISVTRKTLANMFLKNTIAV